MLLRPLANEVSNVSDRLMSVSMNGVQSWIPSVPEFMDPMYSDPKLSSISTTTFRGRNVAVESGVITGVYIDSSWSWSKYAGTFMFSLSKVLIMQNGVFSMAAA